MVFFLLYAAAIMAVAGSGLELQRAVSIGSGAVALVGIFGMQTLGATRRWAGRGPGETKQAEGEEPLINALAPAGPWLRA